MFKCDSCGLCCRNVLASPLYSDLDRGDGVCRFFDDMTKLCRIYDQRPVRCNIDKMYDLYFKDKMSKKDYYKLNYDACSRLKNKGGN